MKIKGFYIVKDKDYHNLLDTFLYYSNIDIVNFLTKYDTSVKNIKITEKDSKMGEVSFFNAPAQVVKNLIKAGETKVSMPFYKMLILGILAGIYIACGASASSVAMHNISNVGIARLVAGCVFPVGFITIVLIGGELFTGNCLMVFGAMRGKYRVSSMIRVLALVFVFNLIGGVLMAVLVYFSGQFNFTDGLLGAFTIKVALSKVSLSFETAFVSGILCNVFVCMAVLMAGSAKSTGCKVWASFFPIMAFVVSGFEHCVANMYYIPAGILALGNEKYVEKAISEYGITAEQLSKLNWGSFFAVNEFPVALGNIVGGSIVMGIMVYLAHKKEI